MINRSDNDALLKIYNLISEEDEPAPDSNVMPMDEFKAFELRLLRTKTKLYRDYPFFGLILTRLRTIPTQDDKVCPTMGVDDNGNIYINPKFMAKLSFQEVIGVLAHETFHIANLTHYRKKGREHKRWNIATDFTMNRDLLEMGMSLPSPGCIPKKEGDKWFIDEKIEGAPPLKVDITDMTCEEVYDALQPLEDAENKAMKEFLESLQKAFDKMLESGESGEVNPVPMDVPSDDPNYTPDSKEGKTESQKESDLKNIISSVVQEMTRGAQKGGMPRGFNQNIIKPKTNWRALLKNFVVLSNRKEFDWARPNKRALASGYYAPKAVAIKGKVDIYIAIDTSGSIQDNVIMVFNSELMKIVRTFPQVKLRVLYWHTEVYKEINLDTTVKSADQIQKELLQINHQSGGTTISCIKSYLDKQHVTDMKGLVVLTDGYIENTPVFPNVKRKLFMIITGGSDEILKKYGPTYNVDLEHA